MERILLRIALTLIGIIIVAMVGLVYIVLPNDSQYPMPTVIEQTSTLRAYNRFYAKDTEGESWYVGPADSTGEPTTSDPTDTITIDTTELDCLHKNIYWEGRNQSDDGKIAIATVTLNRAKSHKFGDTICEVVYDSRKDSGGQIKLHKCQFSWYCDGLRDEPNLSNVVERKAWRKAREIAEGVMLGQYYAETLNADTLYYHTTKSKPRWARFKVKVATVGSHIFYKDRYKNRKS